MTEKLPGKVTVNCPLCGMAKEIKRSSYKASKSKEFFCNWDHYKQGTSVIIPCELCGKDKRWHRSDLKVPGRGRFCSKTCKGKVTSLGTGNAAWKGGRFKSTHGYIEVYSPSHPFRQGNYVKEHRLVMEGHIGRYLTEDEVVHHINHKRDDNRIENLQIMTPSEHSTHHNMERWHGKDYNKGTKSADTSTAGSK